MSNQRSRWSVLPVLLAALLLPGCASTVLTAPCESPRISNLNLPFVYLVVAPYAYRGEPRSLAEPPEPGTAATRTLNEVVTLEAVRMGAEATDMNVSLLQDTGRGCKIENVYAALGDPRSRSGRHVISTIVFFWGEVFDDDAGLVVQSHLRVLWKDDDRIRIRADVGSGADRTRVEFVSDVPYQTLSFAPRRLSARPGGGGAPDLRASLAAWAVPSEENADDRRPLPRKFMFRQLKKNKAGDWAEVQDLDASGTVWIPLRGASVASILPEFSFANALASFVRFKTVSDRAAAGEVARRLDEFRGGYDASGKSAWNARPDAAADVLQGALELVRSADDGGSGSIDKARRLLDRARAALPDDAVVLTLAAMAQVPHCCATKEAAQRLGTLFETARRLDSGNRLIATNLVSWYKLARRLPPAVRPEADAAIASKLADLEEALR
jgi:hypothetical protein